jgi:acyl-coenzyme A thioesterase PaaI-like protein
MALAETVHGGAVLNKIGAFENLMVTENCNLKFLKKAKGDLKVQFQLSAENEAAIKSHLNKNGKCEIELVSAVTDDKGYTVAELTALYHITRLRKKSSKRN